MVGQAMVYQCTWWSLEGETIGTKRKGDTMDTTKKKWCGNCGYMQEHRQLVIGGVLVRQCTFCHIDIDVQREKMKQLITDSKIHGGSAY